MTVKTFRDGERLVIVIEGMEPTSDLDIVKGLLGSIKADTEYYPDAEAAPVPVVEEEIPTEPVGIQVETSYFKGNLEECYDKVDSVKKELELLSVLADNAEMYLSHKFSKMDAKAYAEKLTPVQKSKFFEIYGRFMPENLVEANDVAAAIEYYKQ